MSPKDIIRAWKDEEYRRSLSEAERAQLPVNPAGSNELKEADLQAAVGGAFNFDYLWWSLDLNVDGPATTVDGPICQQNTTDFICRTSKGGPECQPKDPKPKPPTSFY
jgi:mersacidin/lichenicidin family type 2 lantibiotic